MRIFLVFLILSAWALPALAQNTVTTVPNLAALVSIQPIATRPEVHVLGASVPNDEGGGDYVWVAASVASTNAFDSIAHPYGAAVGRWLKRVNYRPILKDATLTGTTTVPSGSGIALPSGSALVAAAGATVALHDVTLTKDPFTAGSLEPASVLFVEVKAIAIATHLVALKALQVSSVVPRMALVRQNTVTGEISDNAIGFWLWDQASVAAESPVAQKSSTLDPSAAGRWLKY